MIITSSIVAKVDKPTDPKLYIADLTVNSLKAKFGENGEYGYAKAFVFNEATMQFMSLQTFAVQSDVIVPANWTTVAQYITEFPQWQAGESYGLGSCAVFTDSFNQTNFWIGLAPSTPGQSPETHPANWYNLSAASQVTVQHQKVLYRLDTRDPEGLTTRQFVVNADAVVTNNGVRTPNIQVFADIQETVSGQAVMTLVDCNVVSWIQSGVVKFQLTFTGDLSEIYYDNGTPSQTNIMITIS